MPDEVRTKTELATTAASNVVASASIPGTHKLLELVQPDHTSEDEKREDVILIPTPSTDPDDPLNWSRGRKFLATCCWSSYVFFLGIANSNLYSVLVPFSEASGLPVATLNAGTGYLFLLAGWTLFWWQPFALQFGKRLTFLISLAAQIPLLIWAVHIRSSGQWYARSILAGFFAAPTEALPEVVVADLYFAHERGRYMALYALVLIGSNFFAPVICGFINDGAGWEWVFYYPAIFCAMALVFAFCFQEETNFDRPTAGSGYSNSHPDTTLHSTSPSPITLRGYRYNLLPSSKSFLSKLRLIDRPRPFMMHTRFLLQLRFLVNPVSLYAGFAYGSALIWFNVLNATSSLVLGAAPYNFSAAIVGLSYLAPLIGVVVGFTFTGHFSDWLMLRFARHNAGVMEPEFRLWIFAACTVIVPAALVLWGVGSRHGVHWFGLLVAMAMLGFQNTCGASLSLNYLIDCYREMSGNALTSVIVVRNTMSFVIGYGITPWIDGMGTQNAFILAAFVGLACSLTFLIMVKWGKGFRMRSARRYWTLVNEGLEKGMLH